jgi:hypothetical protein
VNGETYVKLREIIGGAFEAGHWAWPTPHEPTRALLREKHCADVMPLVLAALAADSDTNAPPYPCR